MIYKHIHIDQYTKLLIWEINESLDQLVELLPYPDMYSTELKQIKTDKRRLEFLASRVAFYQLTNSSCPITYTHNGKPLCIDNQYQLSISHTKQWVAVIVHQNHQVGIDIEVSTPRFEKLYTRFLNQNEQKELLLDNNFKKIELAWSAKEALYKIIGEQAVDFKNQLEILNFELKQHGSFIAVHLPTITKFEISYELDPNFNLVYCIQK